MKSDEERLEQLIENKEFNELTTEEREFVLHTLDSEEEYMGLRKIDVHIKSEYHESNLQPDARILKSLKSTIRKEHRGAFAWHNLIQLKVPAYVTALLVIFSGMAGWIVVPAGKKEIVTLRLVKSDTIFVTKIDTVFRERIVYRQPVNVIAASLKKGEPAELQEKSKPTSVGVSMKDKEELNKLLVSGSE